MRGVGGSFEWPEQGAADAGCLVPGVPGPPEPWRVAKFRKLLQSIA